MKILKKIKLELNQNLVYKFFKIFVKTQPRRALDWTKEECSVWIEKKSRADNILVGSTSFDIKLTKNKLQAKSYNINYIRVDCKQSLAIIFV